MKFLKRMLLTAALCSAMSCAYALPSMAAVRETTTVTAGEGNVMVYVPGTFTYTAKDNLLNQINSIRLEACKEGVTNPDTGSPLTESDYVPIRWSSDLEWIAQTRAAEASVLLGHNRPNGDPHPFYIVHNGESTYSEVLAWNPSGDIVYGISQWYSEKDDWVNNTGAVTGHYTAMIRPSNTYVGLGGFVPNKTTSLSAVAGEFSFSANNETQTPALGQTDQLMEVDASALTVKGPANQSLLPGASKQLKLDMTIYFNLGIVGIKPASVVSWSSSNPAVVSVDSEGNISCLKAGSATITAKYQNTPYSCKVTVKNPAPKKTSIKTLKAGKKKVTISWKKVSEGKGYQIQYGLKKNFKGAKIKTITKASTTKTSITKLKSGKKYYFRVRSTNKVAGKTYRSAWSSKKVIKVK